jgi:hypothetical protein
VCKNNGGSLASYVSQQEQSEVEQVSGGSAALMHACTHPGEGPAASG